MSKFIDLTGKKFGRWTVLERGENGKNGYARWITKCECGNYSLVRTSDLKNNNSQSCGCLKKELCKKQHTTHGMINTRTYHIWEGIKTRCKNSKFIYFKYYGGRGIRYCKRWENFKNFFEDMGECPLDKQIDRIDNNKGYFKENCRWVTSQENNRNKRNNTLITYNSETKCLTEWAEKIKINPRTLSDRINKLNWTIKEAIEIPVGSRRIKK